MNSYFMDPKELEEILDEIEAEGIAEPLVSKLSSNIDLSPEAVKIGLKGLAFLLNGISNSRKDDNSKESE